MNGYLVIKRKPGQRILIQGGIEIKVSKLTPSCVNISIHAPGVKVDRPTKEQDAADFHEWMSKGKRYAAE